MVAAEAATVEEVEVDTVAAVVVAVVVAAMVEEVAVDTEEEVGITPGEEVEPRETLGNQFMPTLRPCDLLCLLHVLLAWFSPRSSVPYACSLQCPTLP